MFVILFAAFPYYAPAIGKLLPVSRAQTATSSSAMHVSFKVQGMTCPICAQGVEHRLNSTNGVKRAAVSYEQKRAEIDYDPKLVTLAQLQQPFKDAGFKAESVQERK